MTDTTIKSIATVFPFNPEELKRNSTLRRRQSIIREFALNYVNTWYTCHLYLPDDVSAGIAIIVHDNTKLLLVEVRGLQLEPGQRHKLACKHRRYDLLPSPYSDCTDKISLAMKLMYTKCGCVNSLQWTARSAVLPGTNQTVEAPLCNSTDSCYAIAMTEILSTDLLWDQFCSDCSQECSTTDFTITPYSVAAPFTVYFPFIKCFVETSNVTLPTNWSST
ncbi:unnamed protein product [Rotaria socialis]